MAGLWGKPTNLNNVKSYAMSPQIILNGAEWFAAIGSPRSPGTAIFALTGKVNNTGLVEVPMGITLGEIIYDIGGGIPGGRQFKAVQTGGPLGGCIPPQHLNVKVDFDSLREVGAVMGSGGMIVVDEDTCMVEFAKFFLTFATAESCGKCVPCRVGGKRMLEILTRICAGQGRREDIARIKEIAEGMEIGRPLRPGPAHAGPGHGGPALFRARVHRAHRGPALSGGLLQGADPGALPERLSGRRRCPGLCQPRGRGPLRRGAGRPPRAQPLRPDLRPRLPGLLRAALPPGRHRRPRSPSASIKRFMADHELATPWNPVKLQPAKAEKVAVIGAGPAGLTAALRLAQNGYPVTVFEALPIAGGMMVVGIPEYRLPRDILNQEIDNIRRAGVEILCNQRPGPGLHPG